jgi:hypothetical protein
MAKSRKPVAATEEPPAAPSVLVEEGLPTVTRRLKDLKSHPRNYQKHPKDQIEHIKRSLQDHGLYRPVVIARGDVILAGHGLVLAAREIGWETIACYFRDVEPDSPEAFRLLAGDNEIGRTAERDDRLLTEMLADVKADVEGGGLLGTGLDEQMLAALLFVTRPASEIRDENEAAEWVGMPEFGEKEAAIRMTLVFRTEEDRERLITELELKPDRRNGGAFAWWPPKDRDDLASVRFEA